MSRPTDKQTILEKARNALQCEANEISRVASRIDDTTFAAIHLLLECKGRVIVTGMGKMGLIGRKAAATFSSTGTPAMFLHPVDALHGDLGIVTADDVVLALSSSGTTEEVITLLEFLRRQGIPLIGLTGNLNSPLAKASDVTLDAEIESEADPVFVAPTASTTVALALCDALAIALMHARGFTNEQFAEYHPGGNLGRRLLTKVSDVMRTGDLLPTINPDATLRESIVVISQKAMGSVFAIQQNKLVGLITDGDLRRILEKHENPLGESTFKFMTTSPQTIAKDALAAEALHLMEQKSITVLPVVESEQLIGAIHLHDLLSAGLA